ncbi:hypothetical protein K490DRAFT_73148 [Saccharata proteae CBS 121410]|uniref:Transfer RNA methyltransferase 82 n=1 Tax=Saccharata proteae CBS 121410 TaxID=1314787 RepID=A0A9P4HYG0_9PEZI|nr:hypothetical protein K490DRAFT_73148 [Saccharata proteae CBS 121410]
MQHPYQCLRALERKEGDGFAERSLLLAASGHKLYSISQKTGNILFTWPDDAPVSSERDQSEEKSEGPPEKKRKVYEASETGPIFIKLVTTQDGEHAVAVTGEDKCIRVFSVNPHGHLAQLSERSMPKRPCAIAVTPDKETILCADKFGDVYALPFFGVTGDYVPETKEEDSKKAFVPSATNLTVHTARNRKALETQMKSDIHKKTKEPLKFKHELLLGHVSMLTDLLFITLDDKDLANQLNGAAPESLKPRSYVLTADRDEHIRISRGPPQSHIIEAFCLGHEEFISKMCLAAPHLLVSGGGDDSLFVWEWMKGRLLRKIPLRDALSSLPDTGSFSGDHKHNSNIAVSGMWGFPEHSKRKTRLLVAFEGIPALLDVFAGNLQSIGEDVRIQAIPLDGNVLDVAQFGEHCIVSVDNVHKAGSTTEERGEQETAPRLRCFVRSADEGQWTAATGATARLVDEANNKAAGGALATTTTASQVREAVYAVEQLRKRGTGGGREVEVEVEVEVEGTEGAEG